MKRERRKTNLLPKATQNCKNYFQTLYLNVHNHGSDPKKKIYSVKLRYASFDWLKSLE